MWNVLVWTFVGRVLCWHGDVKEMYGYGMGNVSGAKREIERMMEGRLSIEVIGTSPI